MLIPSRLTVSLFVLLLAYPVLRALVPGVPGWGFYLPWLGLLAVAALRFACIPRLPVRRTTLGYLVLLHVLLAWLALSSLWTHSGGQYRNDLFYLLLVSILSLLMVFTLEWVGLSQLLVGISVAGVFFGLFVVAEFLILGAFDTKGTRLSEVYLTVANVIGMAATGAGIRFLVGPKFSRKWALVALILLVQLSLSLARGALLSAMALIIVGVGMLALGQLSPRLSFRRWKHDALKVFSVVLIIVFAMTLGLQIERTRTRLQRMFTGNELAEGGRGDIWGQSLASIREVPLQGYGLGSNGYYSRGYDQGYPHNLFLQVWLDGGVLAVFLLAGVALIPGFLSLRSLVFRGQERRAVLILPLLGMYIFQFLEFSKSGNFYAGRGFFLLAIAVVMANEPDEAGELS